MINYDYVIERNTGNKVETFRPVQQLLNLPNAVYIKGPNSLGKSTLLNIIALSCYGFHLTENELPRQLHERLDNLLDVDHQKITFKVEIDNEITGDKLVFEKGNPQNQQVIAYKIINDQKKPMSPDIFNKEFRLVYDIPINPLERLPNLLNEVRNSQINVSRRISEFRYFLQNKIKEIKDSRDPKQIDEIESQIYSIENDIERMSFLIKEKEEEYKVLKIYHDVKRWMSLTEDIEGKKYRLAALKEKKKTIGKNTKKVVKDRDISVMKIRKSITEANNIKQKIKNILSSMVHEKDQVRFSLWKEGSVEEEIYYPDFHNNIRDQSQYFIDWLQKEYDKKVEKSQEIIEKVSLYKVLLNALNDYRFNEIIVPGVNQPVKSFIALIQIEANKFNDEINHINNFRTCSEDLKQLLDIVQQSIPLAQNLQQSGGDLRFGLENVEDLETEIKEIEDQISKNLSTIEQIEKDMYPLTINDIYPHYEKLLEDQQVQIFKNYNDKQMDEKIVSLKKEVEDEKEKINKKRRILEGARFELKRLKEKDTHKLFPYLPMLENYLQKVLQLEKKLSLNFEEYIKRAISPAKKPGLLSVEEKRYYEELALLLGKKIGLIRHIQNQYEVKYVDIFKKQISTKTGEIIKFGDLGTGQGQSAYLEALLNLQCDRKIIALFDEVAMMDEASLRPIKDKIQQLYMNGKLLIAIIVQKDEYISVEALI